MSGERADVTLSDGTALAATRWRGDGPTVVLLHAGVADRRSWTGVADELAADGLDLVAHDRRGFGESPASAADGDATHLADLVELLDRLGVGRAFVVGNSMGGALALDLAVTAPERVAGVLLIGAAVSGMTDDDTPFDWTPDPASGPLMEALDEASGSGDVEAQVRLLAHLWLDGPAAQSGRVTGAPRELFERMNARILEVAAPDGAGDAGLDTWSCLGEVATPVLATWGELDIPADEPFYAETARRLGRGPGRVLPDVAHLPGLERPGLVADLVREVVAVARN
ncbi:alpha/beta fold hydrolase [Frigoribacterium sp. NPDC087798]|uniref:alpha/beta fold hydrolase n=1 Tax=Frigoribacterium sp. NPDC087798 TaxID=3363993 RepID=UPI0038120A6B